MGWAASPVPVVDDDADPRDAVARALERAGPRSLGARDGAEALRLAVHAARIGGLPVVLLGVGLPGSAVRRPSRANERCPAPARPSW